MINQKRLVQTFLDLVKIDSPSGEEDLMAKEVANRMKALGGKVTFDKFGNVIAKFAGKGKPFMLNAHLDTVEPGRGIKPKIAGDKIKSDGSTILGGDDKAGVAVILEALTSLKEDQTPHLSLEVVFTLQEERGSFGAMNLDFSQIKAKRGVSFDGKGRVSNITTAAPGYTIVDVALIGRSAHAGAEPEKGISAIEIAAKAISQLSLGRIDEETTANIGMIEGGSARNAVPERVHLKGEIRSHNIMKMEKHIKHFREVFNQTLAGYTEASIELDINQHTDPYKFEDDHQIIQLVSEFLKKMGLEPNLEPSGGISDVSIFNTHGLEVVDVGAGDYNLHTTREYVVISEMLEAVQFAQELITHWHNHNK